MKEMMIEMDMIPFFKPAILHFNKEMEWRKGKKERSFFSRGLALALCIWWERQSLDCRIKLVVLEDGELMVLFRINTYYLFFPL